jgi:hypothetical protein
MSPFRTLTDLALHIDELLSEPENMAETAKLVEAYLAGRGDGTIEVFEIPAPSDEPADEWADYELPIAELVQGAAALAAVHDLYCPGVEKVISIPAELPPMEDVMPPALRSAWRRALGWRALLTRVRKFGDYALPWMVLQLRRLERHLPTGTSRTFAPSSHAAAPAAVLPATDSGSGPRQDTHDEPNWRSLLASVADENAVAIVNMAQDSTKSADERMRAIYAIDSRALGWKSTRWAAILSVSAPAVRQTDWWKTYRKRLLRD